MTTGFAIRAATFRVLDVPMKKPFGIAGGAQELAKNVLVAIDLASDVRGYGEAAPLPAFNGETQEMALDALRSAAPALEGADTRAWRSLAERIADLARGSASAACALETAALDAMTRALGTSLRMFFGGAEDELVTDVTITTGTVEDAAREAREFAAFSTLKIKVGGRDVDVDVARVLATAAARPDARILLDANGGFAPDDAIRLAIELEKHGVVPVLFEQPIAPGDLAALAEVRAKIRCPVAIDESVTRAEDVVLAHRAGAIDAVNVKLMKSGIAQALDIVAATRACGLKFMIGGMVEARLAMGASACFAAGLGGFTHVDLDTPLFLAEDPFTGGYVQRGETIDLRSIDAGHGAIPVTAAACPSPVP